MKIYQLVLLLGVAAGGCKHDTIEADPARVGAGQDASATDSKSETQVDAVAPGCPSGLAGPAMALISVAEKKHYCIDKTEVTQSQYAKFVVAAGDDLSLIAGISECWFQGNFDVRVESGDNPAVTACPKGEYDPAAKPDQPAGCITWCGAYAYCRWAGKRLCGKIGGGALDDPNNDYKNLAKSQWFYACTQGGTSVYQYGDAYDPACSPEMLEPVTSASSQCAGQKPPYNEITGMNSGVSEWEDSCVDDGCLYRGGGIGNLPSSDGQELRCDAKANTHRGSSYPAIGFRCCLDVD